ncbi:hypothetical protein V2J09_001716 [Rumex salicifolius]
MVQAGATVISIYRSLSKRRLLAPTLLVLVAALTRHPTRVSLWHPTRVSQEAKPSVMIVGVEPVELAAHSYDLFRKYKGIFCDLPIKDDREAYKDRRTLFSRKPDQALVEMEMEVSLAYDLFYTKIWTIVENETGKILHIISLVSEVGYHKVDIKLTNALLVGGLFLDVVSLLKLVFSDLALCHLMKWKPNSSLVTCAMNQLLLVRNRAARWVLFCRWSGSIKQFDLMRYKGNDCCGSRGLGEWMTRTFGIEWGVSEVKLSDDLKNHIFKNIRIRGLYSGSKNEKVGKKTSIVLGEYVLDMWDPNEPIANAIQHICRRLGVVHTLIVWHTATYWFRARNPNDELTQFNELLSKYMMYLLFYHSKMILEGAQLEMSVEDLTKQLIEIRNKGAEPGYKEISDPSSSSDTRSKHHFYEDILSYRIQEQEALKEQEKDLDRILKKEENDDGQVNLIKDLAIYIKKKLESADHPEEIMNEMWIDFLLYGKDACPTTWQWWRASNPSLAQMTHLRLTIEFPDDKRESEAYEMLVRVFYRYIHLDNMPVLTRILHLDSLRRKNVLLLISDLQISMEELLILEQIYNDWKIRAYEILWLPIVDRSVPWTEPMQAQFEKLRNTMPWYSVHHPSRLRFSRAYWNFRSKPVLAVLDTRGWVLSPNVMHMMLVWGSNAVPFTTEREENLWKDETWCLELLIDGIDNTVLTWIRDGKYIFMYVGDDINLIGRFAKEARAVAQSAGIKLEMIYVGKSNKKEVVRKICTAIESDPEVVSSFWSNPLMVWFFWKRIESMLFSKMELKKADDPSDVVIQEVKKILSYDKFPGGWALLSRGSEVILHGQMSTVLTALLRYERETPFWKKTVPPLTFPEAFRQHTSSIHAQDLPCCRFEFPAEANPAGMHCPECHRSMDKLATFVCCHEGPAHERSELANAADDVKRP